MGSLLALGRSLIAIGKTVTMACNGEVHTLFSFLPHLDEVKNTLDGGRDFIITIDTAQSSEGELKLGYKHDKTTHKLSIVVTPSIGLIRKENLSFSTNMPRFDCIITLDVPDIERLGTLYDDHTQLFFETPVINIDHHASNDHFGKINWVDLTATSTCEILVSLLESMSASNNNIKLLTEDVATYLLTGIITDTGSFQNASTTPKSFTVAAQLVGAGARQQEIIKRLFKTKPLTTLRVWGTVLSNITLESNPPCVWSAVSAEELDAVDATPAELTGVIDELLKSTPDVDFALLLSERRSDTNGNSSTQYAGDVPSVDVSALTHIFGGGYTQAAGFGSAVGTLLIKHGHYRKY